MKESILLALLLVFSGVGVCRHGGIELVQLRYSVE